MITTQVELREEFWRQHPRFKRRYRKIAGLGRDKYVLCEQNDYPANTRMAFCDFIDHMARSGRISEALAQRATLK